ncbi:FKBP-type peptidyl-prolyl cis-trans isomerase [Pseudohalioglobus lutimaris]|uniref:Peptidyl-prolyl cis-trans isomerase n=1 Tax=Pseudohalioglobus lutimaris TaxID=1737061 RepID=A0A2N5X8A2_9GAMM|nr:peptidylprolyl isomerase [Pseudohalioglobus lutimaris]PLW70725.1 peptidylprolyl isomerase [Pseudohalioglobus lutimaris]
MSLLIGNNVVASIHYTLTNNSGEVLDSSEGAEPLAYLHGAGNIIPGLENALVGKATGASLQVTIAPEDAYGEVQPELVQVVPREAFQGVDEIEPGMAFEAQDPQGQARRIIVKSVADDEITIDANHPLAGVELNFDVQVVDVRDASEEEVAHGHVH